MCVASGPGKDMFESTLIIATKQYEKAKDLYATANVTGMKLSGPVDFRHQHADMSNVKFQLPSGEQVWYLCNVIIVLLLWSTCSDKSQWRATHCQTFIRCSHLK